MKTESSPGSQPQKRNPIDQALSGWQPARVVMAANRLDFFTTIGNDAITAEEVAARCGCHPRSTRMPLNACVALGILEKRGTLYNNTAEGKILLLRNKPTSIADGIAHQDDLWPAWADCMRQSVLTTLFQSIGPCSKNPKFTGTLSWRCMMAPSWGRL